MSIKEHNEIDSCLSQYNKTIGHQVNYTTTEASLYSPKSLYPIDLKETTRDILMDYFRNSWELYETLLYSITSYEAWYTKPDPLRHPLVFYLGHTAAFYLNKCTMAGLVEESLNQRFNTLFAQGIDPALGTNSSQEIKWPDLEEVKEYRKDVFKIMESIISSLPFMFSIDPDSPLWAILMGIEHERLHYETSSVLIRQYPEEVLSKPSTWRYASSFGKAPSNEMITIEETLVYLGKSKHDTTFGWDNEYGKLVEKVESFSVSKNLISNGEYIEFLECGGYQTEEFWSNQGWLWKNTTGAEFPRFLKYTPAGWRYRAMFDTIACPLDWPVEVNRFEAEAFCRWKGSEFRLPTELEFAAARKTYLSLSTEPAFSSDFNLHLKFGSPNPVGANISSEKINDLYGNVWQWLDNSFYPLPGFSPHKLYADFSLPFFDKDHGMMLGGSWATTGAATSHYYRLWFRPYFYQHAGFRIASGKACTIYPK